MIQAINYAETSFVQSQHINMSVEETRNNLHRDQLTVQGSKALRHPAVRCRALSEILFVLTLVSARRFL